MGATVKPANLSQVPNIPSDYILLEGVEGIDPDAKAACVWQERPFEVGDAVETFGLHSEVGQELNGKNGIITKFIEETGRYEVRFALGMIKNKYEYKVVRLQPSQLVRVNKNPFAKKKLQPQPSPAAASGPVFSRRSFGLDGNGPEHEQTREEEPPEHRSYASDFCPGDDVE